MLPQHCYLLKRLRFVRDDGGRAEAGFWTAQNDCFIRAIATATRKPYGKVRAEIMQRQHTLVSQRRFLVKLGFRRIPLRGGQSVPRRGVVLLSFVAYDCRKGYVMLGPKTHIVAVINGVIHDEWNPMHGGREGFTPTDVWVRK